LFIRKRTAICPQLGLQAPAPEGNHGGGHGMVLQVLD